MGFFKPAGDDKITEADEVDETEEDSDLADVALDLDLDDEGPATDPAPG